MVNDDDHFPDNSSESSDTDRDGIGNNADLDDDGDGVDDIQDACPLDDSETIDTDGDGVCNGDDSDDDGDGFSDEVDEFPLDESEWADLDGDEIGDNADTDPDGDGIDNLNLSGLGVDECPMTYGTANHLRGCLDSDSDGVSDAIDECPGEIGRHYCGCPDRDGDGYADRVDAYPDDEFDGQIQMEMDMQTARMHALTRRAPPARIDGDVPIVTEMVSVTKMMRIRTTLK